MSWTGSSIPNGQLSVSSNKVPIQQNFAYIENTMQEDHFFDSNNASEDGHHKFAQMQKYESGGTPSDPSIAGAMDGVYYVREKTSAEAPTAQRPEPYIKTTDGTNEEILQVGYKCLVNFTGGSSPTLRYGHNVGSITRNGVGLYTINFANQLSSNRYIVTGSAMLITGSSTSDLSVAVRRGSSLGASMTQNLVRVSFSDTDNGQKIDPSVGMIAIMGG